MILQQLQNGDVFRFGELRPFIEETLFAKLNDKDCLDLATNVVVQLNPTERVVYVGKLTVSVEDDGK